jgi:hypothetical protein
MLKNKKHILIYFQIKYILEATSSSAICTHAIPE